MNGSNDKCSDTKAADKQARLSLALRENLRKRKQQDRSRKSSNAENAKD